MTAKVSLKVEAINLESLNRDAIVDMIAARVTKGFEKLGPHLASVAVARAPQSAERNFAPQRGSFQRVQLRPPSAFPGGREGSKAEALRLGYERFEALGRAGQIRALSAAGGQTSSKGITQFFQGTRRGGTLGRSPDIIRVQGGTLKGAFAHQPGELKRSIRFIGVKREGNTVRAVVRAHAPYARPVHEGFTHRGGRKHQGKSTRIKGRKYLKSALVNIRDDLKNKSTYAG